MIKFRLRKVHVGRQPDPFLNREIHKPKNYGVRKSRSRFHRVSSKTTSKGTTNKVKRSVCSFFKSLFLRKKEKKLTDAFGIGGEGQRSKRPLRSKKNEYRRRPLRSKGRRPLRSNNSKCPSKQNSSVRSKQIAGKSQEITKEFEFIGIEGKHAKSKRLKEKINSAFQSNPELKALLEGGHAVVLSRKDFSGLANSIEIVPGVGGKCEVYEKQHLHEKLRPESSIRKEIPDKKILGSGTFKIAKKRTKLSTNAKGYEEDAAIIFKGEDPGKIKREITAMEKVKAMKSSHLLVGKVFRYTNGKGDKRVKIHQPLAEKGELFLHYQGLPANSQKGQSRARENLLGDPKDCLRISSQFIEGIADMHENNQAHMDIKPQNILITESGDAKVTDFGFMTETSKTLKSSKGTRGYMAPELFEDKCDYDPEKADIFSSGMVLHEILQGGVRSQLHQANKKFGMQRKEEKVPFNMAILPLKMAIKGIYPGIPSKGDNYWRTNRKKLLKDAKGSAKKLELARKMMILDMLSISPRDRPSMKEVLTLFKLSDEQADIEKKLPSSLLDE